MRTVSCAVCGQTFEAIGTRAKYCPECKREAVAAQKRDYARRKREAMQKEDVDKEPTFHLCDPPENIERCLTCTIPLRKCHGNCFNTRYKRRKSHEG